MFCGWEIDKTIVAIVTKRPCGVRGVGAITDVVDWSYHEYIFGVKGQVLYQVGDVCMGEVDGEELSVYQTNVEQLETYNKESMC